MANSDGRARGLRALFSSGRTSVPVNKGARSPAKRLPQIDNPVLIGVAGLGALGAGLALRSLRPTHRAGRSERVRILVSEAVHQGMDVHGMDAEPAPVDVQVHEAFGKPPLVSIDVRLERSVDEGVAQDLLDRVARAAWDNPELAPVAVRARVLSVGRGGAAGPDRDNAPRASRNAGADAVPGSDLDGTVGADSSERSGGRREHHLLSAHRDQDPPTKVLADMTVLGYEDETARPADLYAHYGSPASDPQWRP